MVNGVLYKANSDGSLSKQTFDGTNYGPASPVNAADALVNQTDWHTDVKTITSLFYAGGYIYYTKSGTNALYRRGFEIESDIVGQQRFSTTTSGINWANAKGAFVANGKAVLRPTRTGGCGSPPGTRRRTLRPRAPRCRSGRRGGRRGRCSPIRARLHR